MNNKASPEIGPIRLLFELDRVDDPVLFDDLMRCRKGVRRTNRLRLLAHEGAVQQLKLMNGEAMHRMVPVQPALREVQSDASEFEMPLASDVFAEPVDG
ncbi:MAG: hypothetical protein FWD67_10325 [Betaproteobacteria bacterium]|nr:hypothetical protein [Betaproteobacteria bacterium]